MWLFIQSFIVYTLFALAMYGAAKRVTEQESLAMQYPRHWYSMPSGYWMCVLIFAIVSGLRWDVGIDHLQYLSYYEEALDGVEWMRDRGIEEGYAFVTNLFAGLGIHPTIYFGFLAILQIFFLLLAVRNEREAVPYMILALILGSGYLTFMNGIRQMIVACMFVWASQFISDKRFFPYLIFLIVGYTFHHSVVILLPVFLLAYDKTVWEKKWLNILIVAGCFILGNMPTWVAIMEKLGGLLSFIGYDYYADQLEYLANAENFKSYAFGPRKLVVLIGFIISIYIYPHMRIIRNSANVDLMFKLFFIGVCGYYLFDNTLVVFRRPVRYFDIFAIPIAGYTLDYLHRYDRRQWLFVVMLIVSVAFIYLQCYSEIGVPELFRKSTLYQFYFAQH